MGCCLTFLQKGQVVLLNIITSFWLMYCSTIARKFPAVSKLVGAIFQFSNLAQRAPRGSSVGTVVGGVKDTIQYLWWVRWCGEPPKSNAVVCLNWHLACRWWRCYWCGCCVNETQSHCSNDRFLISQHHRALWLAHFLGQTPLRAQHAQHASDPTLSFHHENILYQVYNICYTAVVQERRLHTIMLRNPNTIRRAWTVRM